MNEIDPEGYINETNSKLRVCLLRTEDVPTLTFSGKGLDRQVLDPIKFAKDKIQFFLIIDFTIKYFTFSFRSYDTLYFTRCSVNDSREMDGYLDKN